jgi:DNA-3-methyladenine glycosylase I
MAKSRPGTVTGSRDPNLQPTSADDLPRCTWPGIADPLYTRYHDTEWGVPHAVENALFEKLLLEGFQAGLSWLTILKKRESFRSAFDGFDAEKIAGYGPDAIARLMADPGIIRNRLKVEGAVLSARAYLALREKETLGQLLWSAVGERPITNRHRLHGDVPAVTDASELLSKMLKTRGFRFVGPTTMYAFMQSVGMINDHLVTCHRHHPCRELQEAFVMPRPLEKNDRP